MLPQTKRHMALAQYRQRASFYDAELAAFEPVRRRAIDGLQLQRGNTVLDVGCGTGLSFELLQQNVGSQGNIVGIEQSPEMFALASTRVARHKWRNVTLDNAPAESATIGCRADAALFLFTHDILRDPAGIGQLVAQPWNHLAQLVGEMQALPSPMQGVYIVSGTYLPKESEVAHHV
jgi:SAM-dependent methyltransferase